MNYVFGDFITLDWVKNDRKKIAYGASFGSDCFNGSDESRARMSFFMKQFDAFSVREESGAELAVKEFGVPAEWVLDPVFLCSRNYYNELSKKSKNCKDQKEKYIGVYMLDPNKAKASATRFVMDQFHLPCRAVSDAVFTPEKIKQDWDIETEQHASCEELLLNVKNCDFMITDSFHGVCFAIIYQKPFIAIANERRGLTRFLSILGLLGLTDRLVSQPEDIQGRPALLRKINYGPVSAKLNREKEKSLSWLANELKAPKRIDYSTYDILVDRLNTVDIYTKEVQQRFINVDKFAEGVGVRLNGLDQFAGGTAARLNGLDQFAYNANKHFQDIDGFVNYVNQKFADSDRQLKEMEAKINTVEKSMADMKAYIDYVNSRTVRYQLKKHFPQLWRLLKRSKK